MITIHFKQGYSGWPAEATFVVANWKKQLDKEQLQYRINNPHKIEEKLEV
ncbi:hypothetical protein [Chryseobacterium camelliae]|nr:hypothetical protein [Chryseobacterium camelliae]MDR6514026.1 hypothetical protein [Chryseobacterium camelliae]